MHCRTLAIVGLAAILAGSSARSAEPIDLKVLYAGDMKSARTADFHAFLESHFRRVGLADYLSLRQAETRDYDVVILDWPDLPPRDDSGFKHPALDRDYDRPTILIGGGSVGVGRSRQLKLDDLCICLGDAAHGIVTTHEIFHRPHEIHLAFEERPTPEHYQSWPVAAPLGPTLKVWRVQTRGWSLDKATDLSYLPGMVSDPCGFTDSPECEFIASGLNMKSPEAVAIGRQGNFLLWGFYAPPADLTPEARKCFVNAVCYIKKFDGQRPLVQKTRGRLARQWALAGASSYKKVSNREWFMSTQPESIRNDPKKCDELHRQRVQAYRNQFPEDVRRSLGDDPDHYIAFYRDNLEFLHPSANPGFTFVVDEDVKALGLSNRKVELLDKCVAMLEEGDRAELALRILKRYTTEDFPGANDWRSWLEASRDRLYFTDAGGFKFMHAPEGLRPAPVASATRSEPDATHPVALSAEVSPKRAAAGSEVDFIVLAKLLPTWHIYGTGRSRGPSLPTTLTLKLPKGVEAAGEWTSPEPSVGLDGQTVYEGTVEFRRKLRVDPHAARGTVRISCTIGYQACDAFSCRLPTKETLDLAIEVVEPSPTPP
jgi:hypothetical protein